MPLITISNHELIIQDLVNDALSLQELKELKERELVEWVKRQYLKKVAEETPKGIIQTKLNRVAESGRLREIVSDFLETRHVEVKKRICNDCSLL